MSVQNTQHNVNYVKEAYQSALGLETYYQMPLDRKSAFIAGEQLK